MRKFGIEIRKTGSTENLYQDIDIILDNSQIPQGGINQDIQTQTVAHSLQKMLSIQNHFSVCIIKDCANLCQICISKERMLVYNSIHCMDWNEMTDEYRQLITAMVLDDFRTVLS